MLIFKCRLYSLISCNGQTELQISFLPNNEFVLLMFYVAVNLISRVWTFSWVDQTCRVTRML